MKWHHSASVFIPAFLASIASAQLLTNGVGNLPSCGQTCSTLTQAQSKCNGDSSQSLTAWSCFCKAVWSSSNGALTTMCSTSCSSATDNTQIATWYTNNCGSDNGASEHGGGGSNNAGTGTQASSSSSAPSSLPSTTATGGTFVDGADAQVCGSWWNCHWKWVVMIIVVAIGLLVLGFGGRWLKKRHDRKRDRMSESFNAGITSRNPQQMSRNEAAPDTTMSSAAGMEAGGGRDSPSRTREAFMPYGYGYTRSESRLGGNNDARGSPLARGTTPVNELEKAGGSSTTPQSGFRKKARRVLVRERSSDAEKR